MVNFEKQNSVVEKVWPIAETAAQQNGCTLYDLEFVGGNMGRVLRVYIDRPEGVSLSDCESVSRALNLQLDVVDLIPGGNYHLEVSSPGLDRVLKRPAHFKSAIGSDVQLKVRSPLAGSNQKQFAGKIVGATEESLVLDVTGGSSIEIQFNNIEKAKLVFELVKNKKPTKKKQ